jgi:hypothetical protein
MLKIHFVGLRAGLVFLAAAAPTPAQNANGANELPVTRVVPGGSLPALFRCVCRLVMGSSACLWQSHRPS